jgi:hypothetical protein
MDESPCKNSIEIALEKLKEELQDARISTTKAMKTTDDFDDIKSCAA